MRGKAGGEANDARIRRGALGDSRARLDHPGEANQRQLAVGQRRPSKAGGPGWTGGLREARGKRGVQRWEGFWGGVRVWRRASGGGLRGEGGQMARGAAGRSGGDG